MKKTRHILRGSKVLQFSQNHGLYFRISLRHAINRNYPEALRYIEMAIEQDAYNPDYIFNKACILVELKQTRESIKLLNYIILNIDPTYTECYFGLGCNYFEVGNIEKSLHYFEKYLLMEEDGEFYEDAFEILFHMRMPDEGDDFDPDNQIGISERAQKRSRDSSLKLHAAGSMYLRRGNYKEAIRQFEKSIMAYPEIKSSRIRLSMAYYMSGQVTPAILLANSVLKIQQSNYMAKLCLALYYSTDGKADISEGILSVFSRQRGRKLRNPQEGEDHALYEKMLQAAPVGDEMKMKLQGITRRFH